MVLTSTCFPNHVNREIQIDQIQNFLELRVSYALDYLGLVTNFDFDTRRDETHGFFDLLLNFRNNQLADGICACVDDDLHDGVDYLIHAGCS